MAIGNALVLFNDGESVEQTDFNGLQNALTLRAWEVPGFADMVAFDQFGGSHYGPAFGNGGNGRDYGVFTKGGGLLPTASGLISNLHPGMLGIWCRTGYGVPDADPLVTRSVRWFYLATSWTYTHDATSSGQYRYDLVSCASAEAASVPTARPFQDATTGIATSVTVNKETVLTLDLALSATVTKGVEAGSAGAATIPAIPSGRNLLYYVLVHDSTITTVYDCTIPAGSLVTAVTHAKNAGVYGPGWTDNGVGALTSPSGTGNLFCVAPPAIAGDPSVRILGAYVFCTLTSGDTVTVCSWSPAPAGAPTVLADVSSRFAGGAGVGVLVDLRGLPAGSTDLPMAYGATGPLWANGSQNKLSNGAGDSNYIGIYFTTPGTGRVVYTVTWYAIRG